MLWALNLLAERFNRRHVYVFFHQKNSHMQKEHITASETGHFFFVFCWNFFEEFKIFIFKKNF